MIRPVPYKDPAKQRENNAKAQRKAQLKKRLKAARSGEPPKVAAQLGAAVQPVKAEPRRPPLTAEEIDRNNVNAIRAAVGGGSRLIAEVLAHAINPKRKGPNGKPVEAPKMTAEAERAIKLIPHVAKGIPPAAWLPPEALGGIIDVPTGPPRTVEEAMDRLDLTGDSWRAWRAVARLLDGSELDFQDEAIIEARAGKNIAPARIKQFWGVVGRRGGKSTMAAVAAVVQACRPYPKVISPMVGIVAKSQAQSKNVAAYCANFAERLNVLDGQASSEIVPIKGGVKIRVLPNSVAVRGPNYVGGILDEVAFLDHHDGAVWSDADLLQAVQPGMLGVRAPLLMVISSPGLRRGMLAERKQAWDDGKREPGLIVWHGPTKEMRPSITDEEIAADIELNPGVAPEYEASFFSDKGAWLPAWVFDEEKVVKGMPEKRVPSGGELFAYFDLASGGGQDASALAVSERLPDGRAALIDLIHWPAPFRPDEVIEEGSAALKELGIDTVIGDAYGKGLQPLEWRGHGIGYYETNLSASEIYNEVIGPVLAGRIDWIRHPVMIDEFRNLVETSRANPPPRVTHPGGAHDDAANAAAGALMLALARRPLTYAAG